VLDWWWLTERGDVRIAVVRDGRTRELSVSREGAIPLGVEFADVVFDGVRQCENACSFCFISGLPAGLRPSLYVRDDDYRLSFLAGNFITLTNLDEADRARIVEQRLSPLHVSVHAVDPDVRAGLVCPTVEDRALEHLDTLLSNRIEVHVQIVLVPRVNDGAVLERTLAYLAERDGVLSVGCVPMGFTAHQRRWRASFDAQQARAVLAVVNAWQTRMRAERGVGWVYAADEFHLLAGTPLPGADAYDDFCQFENGIGMVAAFADELPEAPDHVERPITLVTGTMFAPVLARLLRERGWRGVRVLAVENGLFGGNVGVTGLLGGADIVAAVAGDAWTGRYLVPDVVVNSDGLLLDDVRASTLAAEANADVRFIGSDALSLAAALLDS
jgi:putative radical SAM enzyme (TIGR03279 family)